MSSIAVDVALSRQTFTLPDIPELYDPNFLDTLLPASSPSPTTCPKNAMMEALKQTSHRTLTQNGAPTYNSTRSATLDAFQLLNSAVTLTQFDEYLKNSWAEDPEMTLRIIWNIRSIHDGKGEKELFYSAFGWLYENHPRTAIINLSQLVEPVCTTRKRQGHGITSMAHGYWKDLLNILTLATMDQLHTLNPRSFLHVTRDRYQYGDNNTKHDDNLEDSKTRIANSLSKDAQHKDKARKNRILIANSRYSNLVTKLDSSKKFKALYIAVARLFADRLGQDLSILYEINALPPRADRIPLIRRISLAGKWAPTPMCSHDRHTNIATAIISLLRHSQIPSIYPSSLLNPNLNPKEEAIILRSFYQRWVLTPLRSISSVPEPLMCSNSWDQIRYNRVPSICMKNNMERFFLHDRGSFQKYVVDVEKGKKSISGATLFPHEIIEEIVKIGGVGGEEEEEVTEEEEYTDLADREFTSLKEFKRGLGKVKIRAMEAQWNTLVERLRESGTLDNCLAICDVSGSMGSLYDVSYNRNRRHSRFGAGTSTGNSKHKHKHIPPILPAISLSLILASLTKPPFNSGFITFSQNPKFVPLDFTHKRLGELVYEMSKAEWGTNTDLEAVFLKLILPLAIGNNVGKGEMIKRLFVFSDMQFDNCHSSSNSQMRKGEGEGGWKTNYEVIKGMYEDAGYEVPEIVYWDLARFGTVDVDVSGQAEMEGVALMNGFSSVMMKVFMGENEEEEEEEEWVEVGEEEGEGEVKRVKKVKEEFNPVEVMRKVLGRRSFGGLVVVD